MDNVQVYNYNNPIGVQNNAGRDINIHHYPEILPANKIKPIKFHFRKPIDSFRGRDDELKQLTEWFFTNNKNMVVVCGCAGYGKTELCKQFVSRCKDDKKITHILWMEAETSAKLLQSFRDLSKMLQFPELDDQSLVEQIYEYFESSSYIIVFDNAMDRKQILPFEPPGECLCLVTSHVEDWGDDVSSLKLSRLSLDAATDVFHAVLATNFLEKDEKLYRALADTVSCVPLALQIAAAYVRQEIKNLKSGFNLCKHVEYVKHSYEEFIDKPIPNSIPNTYDKSVFQAIQISLTKIQSIETDTSKLACHVLHVCAYLYPEEILHSDLLNISYLKELLTKSENSSDDLNRACTLLTNYSFISDTNKKISIHRLIQDTVIFQQKLEKIIHYYPSCLELLLLDDNIANRHRHFILQYPEKRLEMFEHFFSQHKPAIISTPIFFYHLIATNCKLYLREIFDEIGSSVNDVINKNYMLHHSVIVGQHDILEFLLERGADVSNSEGIGNIALFIAAEMLDLRAAKILIDYDSDVNTVGEIGENVLHSVILASGKTQHIRRSKEACKMLRWLAKCGARTDAVQFQGDTLLHSAAYAHSAELIHFLVREFNQNVNARDLEKRTPLYYVSDDWRTENKERRLRTTKYLLELGAEIDIKDDIGLTPAEHARAEKHEYLAQFLENPLKFDELIVVDHNSEFVERLKTLVITGDISRIKQKLDEFGKCAAEKINKYNLLHEAAENIHHEVLRLLLQYGANVNSRNDRNLTALDYATVSCQLFNIFILVQNGADINATEEDDRSILHDFIFTSTELCRLGKQRQILVKTLFKWLVARGARTDALTNEKKTLIHLAAFALHTDLIDFLIHDLHQDVQALDVRKETPLFDVSRGLECLKEKEELGINTATFLLKHGAKVDVVSQEGLTPAQEARQRGHEKLAEYLEKYQAQQIKNLELLVATGDIAHLTEKLNEFEDNVAQKINKFYLLHLAAEHWQHAVIELLLARGADINHRNDRNITPLHVAARRADLQAVKLLVNHASDVHAISEQGVTVLHALGLSGRGKAACAVLQWLVQHGADTSAVTQLGVSLLHVAAAALDPDLVRYLVSNFQHDVHVVDAVGQTPLFYVSRGLDAWAADEKQAVSTATCLLELGAHRNVVDADGFTPAQNARVWGFDDLAATLDEQHGPILKHLASYIFRRPTFLNHFKRNNTTN